MSKPQLAEAGVAISPECTDMMTWIEEERLAALAQFAILDTEREPQFDNIVQIASEVCETPIAVVNFIASDRQWFKAETGIGQRELPLEASICRHAILQPGLFVVPDLSQDPRFVNNPLVTAAGGLRFYAGALLETNEGLPLGTVCVLDTKPRPEGLTGRQSRLLQSLARQVMTDLKLRMAIAERDAEIARSRESAALLRLGSIVAGLGLGVLDYRNGLHTLDTTAAALFDLPADVPIPRADLYARIHPEDEAEIAARMAHLLGPQGEGFVAFEHRILRSDGSVVWVSARLQIDYEGEGQNRHAVAGLLALRDISSRKRAEESRELLLHETNHRIKNLFALASGLVSLTAHSAATPQEMKVSLNGRLAALAASHDLTGPHTGQSPEVQTSNLHELLTAISKPYVSHETGQIRIGGPPVHLGSTAVTSLALALHELATNAAKYGAFSTTGGLLDVAWRLVDDHLLLMWVETCEGAVGSPPAHFGFGSKLIRTSIEQQLDGSIDIDWKTSGVEIALKLPLARLQS